MLFLSPMIVAIAATSASVAHADTLRQHHQRALLDTCGNINANLRIRGVSYGRINRCLCVSGIPALLQSSNRRVRAALGAAGRRAVTASLRTMVRVITFMRARIIFIDSDRSGLPQTARRVITLLLLSPAVAVAAAPAAAAGSSETRAASRAVLATHRRLQGIRPHVCARGATQYVTASVATSLHAALSGLNVRSTGGMRPVPMA